MVALCFVVACLVCLSRFVCLLRVGVGVGFGLGWSAGLGCLVNWLLWFGLFWWFMVVFVCGFELWCWCFGFDLTVG